MDPITPFNGLEVTHNTNEYNYDRFYCEMAYQDLCDRLAVRTAAGKITNISKDKAMATIYMPYLDEDALTVGMIDAYDCEICENSNIVLEQEVCTLDKQWFSMYPDCEITRYFSCTNYAAKISEVINRKFAEYFDRYIFATVFAQADNQGLSFDPTDCESIKAMLCAAKNKWIGYDINTNSMCAFLPASAQCAIEMCLQERMTIKGDGVCENGWIAGRLQGFDIIFVADSQLGGSDKAIFAIGKPVDAYIDEAGFMSGKERKQGSTPMCINFNYQYFRTLFGKAHIWNCNQDRICAAPGTGGGVRPVKGGGGFFVNTEIGESVLGTGVGQVATNLGTGSAFVWTGSLWQKSGGEKRVASTPTLIEEA